MDVTRSPNVKLPSNMESKPTVSLEIVGRVELPSMHSTAGRSEYTFRIFPEKRVCSDCLNPQAKACS